MARVFDVVEYPNEMRDEIVRRFPESGPGDFRIGSQVIVREAQMAVFFRDGNALDVFGPGRHTITTMNIPLIVNFLGKIFNERTPFPAEVYFRLHARVRGPQMGHSPADHRAQPGHGPGRGAAAGLRHL
jgi:membrane protease subunit (stomatin/prohibitin family)